LLSNQQIEATFQGGFFCFILQQSHKRVARHLGLYYFEDLKKSGQHQA
jgi:hypothetical protein